MTGGGGDGPASPPTGDGATADGIVVYWRPGCGYCAVLRRGLDRAGVAVVERNIWDDPEAAAFVRGHAGGNETVPTVDVAGTVLVNPGTRRVLAVAAEQGLAVPPRPVPWWRRAARRR